MILIISKETDSSTDNVIDWLTYYNCNFIRFNKEDEINSITIDIINSELKITFSTIDKIFNYENIKSIWYRKNGLNLNFCLESIRKINKQKIKEFKRDELGIIKEFIELSLLDKEVLGSSLIQKNLNKLFVLNQARLAGLSIPDTRVTNEKLKIPNIQLIVKAISEIFFNSSMFWFFKQSFIPYTVELQKEQIKLLPDIFFPTLFQQKIDKSFEIRIFHLVGVNYSMAIFSQKNERTKIDFRRYDEALPNRTIPFKLPNEIENKINSLMRNLKLDTGSIDMIVDKDGDYYFLEINPVGQFGMVSTPCNYYLEKKIAAVLKEKTKYYETDKKKEIKKSSP